MKLVELLNVLDVGNGGWVYVTQTSKRKSEQVYARWECSRCKKLMERCETMLDAEVGYINYTPNGIHITLK